MTKKISKILFFALLTIFIFGPISAMAWNLELTNVDGTLGNVGDYYSMDINFQGELDDNLNLMGVTLSFNKDLLSYTAIMYEDYNDGGFPFPQDVWDGGMFPTDDTVSYDGLIGDINGSEPLGSNGVYYPMQNSQNKLATIWFTVSEQGAGQEVIDVAGFIMHDTLWAEQVVVNDTTFGDMSDNPLLVEHLGSSSHPAPVPLPPAFILLFTGILGLFGIIRKKSSAILNQD